MYTCDLRLTDDVIKLKQLSTDDQNYEPLLLSIRDRSMSLCYEKAQKTRIFRDKAATLAIEIANSIDKLITNFEYKSTPFEVYLYSISYQTCKRREEKIRKQTKIEANAWESCMYLTDLESEDKTIKILNQETQIHLYDFLMEYIAKLGLMAIADDTIRRRLFLYYIGIYPFIDDFFHKLVNDFFKFDAPDFRRLFAQAQSIGKNRQYAFKGNQEKRNFHFHNMIIKQQILSQIKGCVGESEEIHLNNSIIYSKNCFFSQIEKLEREQLHLSNQDMAKLINITPNNVAVSKYYCKIPLVAAININSEEFTKLPYHLQNALTNKCYPSRIKNLMPRWTVAKILGAS